jgi:hypothetical protein
MKRLVLFGTMALLLIGCIPSVKSFYTEKDLAFEPRLLGEWQVKNESDQPAEWQFERGEGKAYKMTVIQEKIKRGEFNAHLFKLGKENFLDIIPSKIDYASDQADLVSNTMFPGHLLLRVSQIDPVLKLAGFDFDWLKAHLEENPKALAHHKESDAILLTAGTADLQSFVLAHLGEGQLFTKGSELMRKAGTAAQ